MNKQNSETKENSTRVNMSLVFVVIALILASPFCFFLIVSRIIPCLDSGCGDGIAFSAVLAAVFSLPLLFVSKLIEPTPDNTLNDNVRRKKRIAKHCRIIVLLLVIISILAVFIPYYI